jgi:hypothetical protein
MSKALATATVDGLLHHAHVVMTAGVSFRLAAATPGKGWCSWVDQEGRKLAVRGQARAHQWTILIPRPWAVLSGIDNSPNRPDVWGIEWAPMGVGCIRLTPLSRGFGPSSEPGLPPVPAK